MKPLISLNSLVTLPPCSATCFFALIRCEHGAIGRGVRYPYSSSLAWSPFLSFKET